MAFGKLKRQENLDPKINSSTVYYSVMVMSHEIETLLITEKEIDRIRKRVARNPEDTKMIPSWWDKFIASIAG